MLAAASRDDEDDITTFSHEEFAEDIKEALKNDPVIAEALLQPGSKLREHSAKIEKDLRAVEVESVRDYVRQSSRVADLHAQMRRCDGILAGMQERLLGFEADLGSAASELRSLRSESRRLATRLENRKSAGARLGGFLRGWALDPAQVELVVDGAVGDDFVEAVEAVDAALAFVDAGEGKNKDAPGFSETWRSCRDCAPALEKLRAKAAARCRDELLARVQELHGEGANVHVLQRARLARVAPLNRFLERQAPEMAVHVRAVYVDSMARTLHGLFRAYHAELEKLDLEVANRHDVVAVPEDEVRSALSGRVSLSKRGDGFSLGDRAAVLDRVDAPPLLVHVARAENKHFPFEELFRSSLRHLSDAATSEFHFVAAFLHGGRSPVDDAAVQRTLGAVFAKAFSATLEHLENKLFACHDAVGLLLVVRLVAAARRRGAPGPRIKAFDAFLVDCERLLRPRLAAIFAANDESVRKADPSRLGPKATGPHYVARRYGELHAAVLALFPDEARAVADKPPPPPVGSPGAPGSPDTFSNAAVAPARAALDKMSSAVADLAPLTPRRRPSLPRADSYGDTTAAADAAAAARGLRDRVAHLLEALAKRLPDASGDRAVFLANNYDLARARGGEPKGPFEMRVLNAS